MEDRREQMNIVIVGHVDHGKSTVIGRLLADTGSLPEGKLEQVRHNCELNAKPFEYAFLLDALKDEQAQGITIDAARCFFKTEKRHYIIIDAPGHIEFLKNMITGAARAEAALLVIDAHEGVRENSRRHGFMLSLLGIRQIVVLVNKMDLVDYRSDVFQRVKEEYQAFLDQIHLKPLAFVPISAREGDNLIDPSSRMPWYDHLPVLSLIDSLSKEKRKEEQPFRLPVQDIYKFTEDGDDRRIFAGTVETGEVRVGDEVVFLPSQKRTSIGSIEGFNEPARNAVGAGRPTGLTINTQIYVKPGEVMCRVGEPLPHVGTRFRANIFWLGKQPMIREKRYKLKIAANRASVFLRDIVTVLDASDLTTQSDPEQICRHDVAECILQTAKPITFDLSQDIEGTGRFVIIDDYEIVGGGIITEKLSSENSIVGDHVAQREYAWVKSAVSAERRSVRFQHRPKFVVLTGGEGTDLSNLAEKLEESLFEEGRNVYYLGNSNLNHGLDSEIYSHNTDREEEIRRLGEMGRIFSDAGMIIITTIAGLDDFEVEVLKQLNAPYEILVVQQGTDRLEDASVILPIAEDETLSSAVDKIKQTLKEKDVILDYYL